MGKQSNTDKLVDLVIDLVQSWSWLVGLVLFIIVINKCT